MSAQPSSKQRSVPTATITGFLLFALTLLFELPGVFARIILTKFVFWLFFFIINLGTLLAQVAAFLQPRGLFNGQQQSTAPTVVFGPLARLYSLADPIAQLAGWGPFVIALLTALFLPGGFLWTRIALGARKPSTRERAVLQDAFGEATRTHPQIKGPSAYYVIDNAEPNAYTIGTTLYVHSGLLVKQHEQSLVGLIGHELAHRNSYDGRLILALRRLVLPPIYLLSRSVGTIAPGTLVYSVGSGNATSCLAGMLVIVLSSMLALAGGGFGAWLLSPAWAMYWRGREFAADAYAKQLGVEESFKRGEDR